MITRRGAATLAPHFSRARPGPRPCERTRPWHCASPSLRFVARGLRPRTDPAAESANAKASNPALGARWQYPREREIDGRKVIVYAPQIRSWDQFKHFTAQVAVEFLAEDASARYA